MRGRSVLGLAMLPLLAGGCASVQGAFDSLRASAASLVAPKEGRASAEQLAAAYRAQAAQRERDGQLRPAAEAWTTALALAPDHEPSQVALKRVRWQLNRELAERLKRGWSFVAREAPAEARQEFVAALTLDPYSTSAHEGLRAVAVAERDGKPASTSPPGTPPPPAGGKASTLYGAALAHLAEGRDEEAYRALTQLERLSPGYADSARLLGELRAQLARRRYQDGLRLLREERLEEAIEQWRGVLALDAQHAHARRNIEQAEKMLRTLAAQPRPEPAGLRR